MARSLKDDYRHAERRVSNRMRMKERGKGKSRSQVTDRVAAETRTGCSREACGRPPPSAATLCGCARAPSRAFAGHSTAGPGGRARAGRRAHRCPSRPLSRRAPARSTRSINARKSKCEREAIQKERAAPIEGHSDATLLNSTQVKSTLLYVRAH